MKLLTSAWLSPDYCSLVGLEPLAERPLSLALHNSDLEIKKSLKKERKSKEKQKESKKKGKKKKSNLRRNISHAGYCYHKVQMSFPHSCVWKNKVSFDFMIA